MISVEKHFLMWPIQIPRMEYEINNQFRLKHFTSEDGSITFLPDVGIRLQNYIVIDRYQNTTTYFAKNLLSRNLRILQVSYNPSLQNNYFNSVDVVSKVKALYRSHNIAND
jgi:hypothetical protein